MAHEHAHDHGHSHAHPHDYSARAHPENVMLDLGGDVGALILHTDPAMHGVEVEISPDGAARDGRHKQILERFMGGRSAFTAVFDELEEGSYTLWVGDEPRSTGVAVQGGRVAELDWRGPA